jgi:AcrR family transcriptional regulator
VKRLRSAVGAADHRTRVGHQRSARTRQQIIEAALSVFAERGPDAPVIDDFLRAAGIARGTFYRHFRTTEALRDATSTWLEETVMRGIDASVSGIAEPDLRLACGVRAWLEHARTDPVLCAFIVRNRARVGLVEQRVGSDIEAGRRAGCFVVASTVAGRDLLIGTIRESMARMMSGRVSRKYTDGVAMAILRGLGVEAARITQLMALPLTRA